MMPSLSISIRSFVAQDLDDLIKIEQDVHQMPWSRRSYEELIDLESVQVWVAYVGDELIGYMLLQWSAGEGELHTIAVKKDWQGRGVGKALLEYLLQEARALKLSSLFLQVRPSNTAAQKLYQKFGFRLLSRRKHYYEDNGEDALVMQLTL